MTGRLAIAQVGGPTAVMNASLLGFLKEASPESEVYGILDGLQGLSQDRLVLLSGVTAECCRHIGDLPGAWLGAGRWPADEEDFERYVQNLRERDVHGLALIGGNGTMWACMQLERTAGRLGYELAIVGIPKTVDNDLAETDHAPGFGSAARFVATMVRDIGKDLEAMRNFEAVRILETMGRNVGWLAMSAGYLKETPQDPPHLIYVPERAFDEESFLCEAEEARRSYGYAVVVVSEGLTPHERTKSLETPILGGVSRKLARTVNRELGLAARGELLGMGQRSYALAVSDRDREEARMLGTEAARMLREGRSGVMAALHRADGPRYEVQISDVPFDRVAGLENPFPEEWLLSPGEVHEEFREWLVPLVGEDLTAYPPNMSEAGDAV